MDTYPGTREHDHPASAGNHPRTSAGNQGQRRTCQTQPEEGRKYCALMSNTRMVSREHCLCLHDAETEQLLIRPQQVSSRRRHGIPGRGGAPGHVGFRAEVAAPGHVGSRAKAAAPGSRRRWVQMEESNRATHRLANPGTVNGRLRAAPQEPGTAGGPGWHRCARRPWGRSRWRKRGPPS